MSYVNRKQSRVSCAYNSPVQRDRSKLKLLEIKRLDLDALPCVHQHNEVSKKSMSGVFLGFSTFQNTLNFALFPVLDWIAEITGHI